MAELEKQINGIAEPGRIWNLESRPGCAGVAAGPGAQKPLTSPLQGDISVPWIVVGSFSR